MTDRECCAYTGPPFGLWVQSLTGAERVALAEADGGVLTFRFPVQIGAPARLPRLKGEGYRLVTYGHLGAVRSRVSVIELCASCGRGRTGPEITMWGRPRLDRLRRRITAATGGAWSLSLEDANGALGVYVWAALAVVPVDMA